MKYLFIYGNKPTVMTSLRNLSIHLQQSTCTSNIQSTVKTKQNKTKQKYIHIGLTYRVREQDSEEKWTIYVCGVYMRLIKINS